MPTSYTTIVSHSFVFPQEELDQALQKLLELKARYKDLTGVDLTGGAKRDKKSGGGSAADGEKGKGGAKQKEASKKKGAGDSVDAKESKDEGASVREVKKVTR